MFFFSFLLLPRSSTLGAALGQPLRSVQANHNSFFQQVCTLQTISGTGAVHLGGLFLSKFHPQHPQVYVSNPTWANHHQIFDNIGLSVAKYPYFSPKTKGLDIDGMLATLRAALPGSVVLLHACAHNPTGVDPTQEQWKEIAAVIRERQHFPFFDCAYQGFASGDLARDAWAIRYFVEQGFELCIAQSFAKNLGLYGQRTGAFHFVSAPGAHATASNQNIASQLAILQRSEISNPPAYGARIASRILNDPQLFAEWEEDLRTMSGRIQEMRKGLRARLEAMGTPGTWDHVTNQIGMFSFTGLTETQVKILREKWHIYMVSDPFLILFAWMASVVFSPLVIAGAIEVASTRLFSFLRHPCPQPPCIGIPVHCRQLIRSTRPIDLHQP